MEEKNDAVNRRFHEVYLPISLLILSRNKTRKRELKADAHLFLRSKKRLSPKGKEGNNESCAEEGIKREGESANTNGYQRNVYRVAMGFL